MKHMIRLLALLLALLLPLSGLAETPIEVLGEQLVEAQAAFTQAEEDLAAADKAVAELEKKYEKNPNDAKIQDQLIDAMVEQELAAELHAEAQSALEELQQQHALRTSTVLCKRSKVKYRGEYADIQVEVLYDEDMVIHDISILIYNTNEKHASLNLNPDFRYRFIGKDIPVTIGYTSLDEIRHVVPIREIELQRTCEDVVAAVNSLSDVKPITELGKQLVRAQAAVSNPGGDSEDPLAFFSAMEDQNNLSVLQSRQERLIKNNNCEDLYVEYDGKYADLAVTVTVDEDMFIYALTAQVKGSERDQLVGKNDYLYQFIGKDLPLSIGNGKNDDVAPLGDAQQTSKDLVAALNSLIYEEPEEKKTAKGPITDPQGIADYIFEHGKLPDNFITKKEAQKLGWDSSYNYVGDVAPGKSIGGDRFGNYEGLLPTKKGRQWYEADCYYEGKKRNAHRILYSNDGLVYYTDDHYESFTQMFPSKK